MKDKYQCGHCKKEYYFEFKGMISPFSPILFYCEECIEKGYHKSDYIKKKIEDMMGI